MAKWIRSALPLSCAVVVMALSPVFKATAAVQPKPPSSICIDDSGCVTTPAEGSNVTAIKWHPGVYVDPGNARCTSEKLADSYNTINEIGSMPNVKGVHLRLPWSCLEGSTQGDYSAGFALIDGVLDRLATAGNKRLILQLWPMGYGSCDSTNSSGGVYTGTVALPLYVKNHSPSWVDYCVVGQDRTYTAKLYDSGLMDRVIALSAAYAARYNNHPLFEMWEPHEETVGLAGNVAGGFTWTAAEKEWNRMLATTAAQWKNTLVHDSVNYMQNDTMIRNQFTTNKRAGLTFGTCDNVIPRVRMIPGVQVYIGNNGNGSDNTAWSDMRSAPGHSFVTRVMWGSLYRDITPQEAQDFAYNTMHATYIVWWRQTYYDGVGDQSQQWPAVKAFINAGKSKAYSTACPVGWTCNTN